MKNIIMDYDGTATNNHERAGMVLKYILKKFSDEYNVNFDFLEKKHCLAKEELKKNDVKYPYVKLNEIVCYCEDELIIDELSLTKIMNDHCYQYFRTFQLKNPMIFSEAYEKTTPFFVEGLADFLKKNMDNLCVVSNVSNEKISEEIMSLGLEPVVIGNARKHHVNPRLKGIKERILIGERTINIDRPFYRTILENFNPEESIVVGDNFSMDLALPLSMGFDVALVKNEYNSWAQKYMKIIGKKVIENVSELD